MNKHEEERFLELFLSARESATGQRMKMKKAQERPDFICVSSDGIDVGVEITRIAYDHSAHEMKRVMEEDIAIDNMDLFYSAYASAERKAMAKKEEDWSLSKSTILVLQLVEGSRIHQWPTTSELSEEFSSLGFLEIWLADHATVEPFGAVSLYGIFPPQIWGLNGQRYLYGKPYG